MTIRRGTAKDVPRALEIWRSAVDATHAFLTPADRAEIDAMVANDFLPNAELWLALDDDGQAVGFLIMDGAIIDALFVDPAAILPQPRIPHHRPLANRWARPALPADPPRALTSCRHGLRQKSRAAAPLDFPLGARQPNSDPFEHFLEIALYPRLIRAVRRRRRNSPALATTNSSSPRRFG